MIMRSSSLVFPLASCMVAISLASSRVQASTTPRVSLQPVPSSHRDRASGSVQHAVSVGVPSPGPVAIATKRKDTESQATLSKEAYTTLAAYMMGTAAVVCQNRFDCFASVMTGHIISLVTAVTEFEWKDVAKHGSMLTGFGTGVALFRRVDVNIKNKFELHCRQPAPNVKPVSPSNAVVAAPLILALLCSADIVFHLSRNDSAISSTLLGAILRHLSLPILSLAFGFCNAAASDATGGVITFAMTGHATAVFRSLADGGITGKARTSARALAGFVSGVALASLAANVQKTRSSSIKIPVFSCMGVIFALLLMLRSRPEDMREAARILVTKKTSHINPKFDVYVSQTVVSLPFVGCTMMDGWTKLPSGPAPFQDGS